MDASALVACLILVAMIALGAKVLARSLDDFFAIFFLTFALFYGFRAILIAVGLDLPYPGYLFAGSDVTQLVVTSVALIAVFLAAFTLSALLLLGRNPSLRPGPIFARRQPPLNRMMFLTLALTALSVAISAALFARYGGLSGMITAAKIDKDLAGLYVLKTAPVFGAFVSAAAFVDARRSHASSLAVLATASCAVVNGLLVFGWGQRSVLAVALAIVVVGARATTARKSSKGHTVARVLLAAFLVVGIAVGLRIARDTLTHGEVQSVYDDANIWGKLSLGVNGQYYDASLLAYRDWPAVYSFRSGEDFKNGLLGTVPHVIWAAKPDPLPGKWFRQVYQPTVENGWPIGAPAIWYLNFGSFGVALGGAISGVVAAWLARKQRASPPCGINTAVCFILAVYVFPLGWSSDTPLQIVSWLGPLAAIIWWLQRSSNRSATSGTSEGAEKRSAYPRTP